MARGSILKQTNKDGSTTYYIRYRDLTGREIKKAIGPRKKDAERILSEIMKEIHQGDYKRLPDITFGELAIKWYELKKTQVRPITLRMYKAHLNLRLLPTLGPIRAKSISQEMIEGMIADLNDQGLAPETVRKALHTLKSVLKKGIEWGYLNRSPAEFAKPPRRVKSRIKIITPKEMERLIASSDEAYKVLILTACYTGTRASELFGLKWADVDFEKLRIHVQRTYQDGKYLPTKSASSNRQITVQRAVIDALRKHKEGQVKLFGDLDIIFTNTKGGPMSYRNVLLRGFKPALKKAGLPDLGFHSLRHSYTAALISAGENIKFIQRQLGHSSINQTMDIYGHLLPEIEKEAPERLKKIFVTTT